VPTISARFDALPGTQASEGRAGGHAVIVDRPEGVAGGRGLGFNGGQLLALAIGGCLCNDLRYVADRRGAALGAFGIEVDLDIEDGDVTRVIVRVDSAEDRDAIGGLLDEAVAASTIVRAVTSGAPVDVTLT
jgi:organic hydroperoxide reductase OsmC/OhrA